MNVLGPLIGGWLQVPRRVPKARCVRLWSVVGPIFFFWPGRRMAAVPPGVSVLFWLSELALVAEGGLATSDMSWVLQGGFAGALILMFGRYIQLVMQAEEARRKEAHEFLMAMTARMGAFAENTAANTRATNDLSELIREFTTRTTRRDPRPRQPPT